MTESLGTFFGEVSRDAAFAVRACRRRPGFTAIVLLTLSIGTGASVAIFSLVNAVLLRPLPYRAADRLVTIWETQQSDPSRRLRASYPEFIDWRNQRDVFAAVEGLDGTNVTVTDSRGAEIVRGARVTSGYFRMLGFSPLLGRFFERDDDQPNGALAVVVSYGFWSRHFNKDEHIVGKTVSIDGQPHEVRGVLPASFPTADDLDVWLPLGRDATTRGQRFNHWIEVIARLRDGVTVQAAQLRIDNLMRTLSVEYPATNAERDATVIPLRDSINGQNSGALLVLLGAVGVLLLIACANVANLLLVRTIERGRELAVRLAVGASRRRIVRQLITESLLLSVAGTLLGAGLGALGIDAVIAMMPGEIVNQMPAIRDTSPDGRVVAFTIALALLTGVLFGVAPAAVAIRQSLALRTEARTGSTRAQRRARDVLVVGEVALTLLLLVSAGLIGRSLSALLTLDPGFTAEGVAVVRVPLSGPSYRDRNRQAQFFEALIERLRSLPGVAAVGAISSAPLQGGGTNEFHVDGSTPQRAATTLQALTRAVAGDYFSALRIPIVEGRAVSAEDNLRSPYAVVISHALAKRLFGSGHAVGRRLRFDHWEDSAWTIVGVVGDVATDGLDEGRRPTIYYSHLQGPANRMSVFVRSATGDAASLIGPMRKAVPAIDATVPISGIGVLADGIAESRAVARRRFVLTMLSLFAGAALVLAVVGLYGNIAYSVAQRAREFAIRSALGADSHDVLALVLRAGIRVTVAGVLIGGFVTLGVARVLSSLLFGIGPGDPLTYLSIAGVLGVVALIASFIGARRALHTDPALVMRSE